MAEKLNLLTTKEVASLLQPGTKPGRYADGGGLYLKVRPGASRQWVFMYASMSRGKRVQTEIGLGSATPGGLSLAAARQKAEEARRARAGGNDPLQAKRASEAAAEAAAEGSFGALAQRLLEKKRREKRAPVTIIKTEWILRKVADRLNHRPIAEITTPEIIAVLRREEEAGNLETAARMRIVLGGVFRYAMAHGLITSDPVQATKGAIARANARPQPAILDPEAFGDMLRRIDAYAERNVLTGSALRLMALLYPRPGELRQAEWSEFDLDRALWTIPAGRTKMRKAHVKPLSRQALAILEKLQQVTGPRGLVFPAIGKGVRPMSENTMNGALRRIGIAGDAHVAHGFRSTASTMLNDSNLFSPDAIERELAHQDADAVRRAYRRGEAIAERITMAQWWADHLDMLKSRDGSQSNIVPLVRGAERG